ncbi:MAG: Peptidase S8 and S53, subtilisin, kexin, sedolisin, partial [Candidatus Uhrbacteria bacterium GW2011_GWF2_41_430]
SGDTVSGSIEITTKSSANRGVARIEYLIDNMVVNITNNTTSATITIPSWVGNGTHTLRVVAYDDIDNWGDDQISINVEGGSASSGARISNPLNDQEIEATEATYTIGVELSGPEALSVSVYQQNLITGSLSLIGTVDSPGSISTFTWTLPTTGEYLLSGSVETTDGKQDIEPIRVRVIQPSSSSSSSSSPFEYLSSEEETEVVE